MHFTIQRKKNASMYLLFQQFVKEIELTLIYVYIFLDLSTDLKKIVVNYINSREL